MKYTVKTCIATPFLEILLKEKEFWFWLSFAQF